MEDEEKPPIFTFEKLEPSPLTLSLENWLKRQQNRLNVTIAGKILGLCGETTSTRYCRYPTHSRVIIHIYTSCTPTGWHVRRVDPLDMWSLNLGVMESVCSSCHGFIYTVFWSNHNSLTDLNPGWSEGRLYLPSSNSPSVYVSETAPPTTSTLRFIPPYSILAFYATAAHSIDANNPGNWWDVSAVASCC